MDKIDQALLQLLHRNGRESISNLAAHLKTSRITVKSRLDKMRASGIIQGFTVIIDPNHLERPVRAITLIQVDGNGADRVARHLLNLPLVQCVHSTNGSWDLIAEISGPDLHAFDGILSEIRRIPGVAQSQTNLLLSTRYE